MLSTMKVILPVARDVIFVNRNGRCVSGKTVFGAETVRLASGAAAKRDKLGVDGAPLEIFSGRGGTANTASVYGRSLGRARDLS